MEFRVVIDDRVVRVVRRVTSKRAVAVLGLLFIAVPLVIYAGVPHIFEDGNIIYAEDMNENFENLDSRLEGYESTIHVDEETGNVGIGTEEPNDRLHIQGVNGEARIRLSGSSGSGSIGFDDSDDRFEIASLSPDPIAFVINGVGDALTLANTGAIGVGTSTPKGDLQIGQRLAFGDFLVGGPAFLSQIGYNVYWDRNNSEYKRIDDDEVARIAIANGDISFWTGSTEGDAGSVVSDLDWGERLVITRDGNVGIGATAPDDLLVVGIGEETFRGITVRGAGKPQITIESTTTNDLVLAFKNPTVTWTMGTSLSINHEFDLISDGTSRLHVTRPSGNVGIGTTSPQQRLHVAGNVTADDYLYNSDIRLKTDVNSLEGGLEGIQCLRGVSYRWKDPEKSQNLQLGLIAQEVEDCFPEVVTTDDSGFKSVAYGRLVAPIVEAIKAQQRTIESLEEKVVEKEMLLESQNARMSQLERRVEDQQQEIAAMKELLNQALRRFEGAGIEEGTR